MQKTLLYLTFITLISFCSCNNAETQTKTENTAKSEESAIPNGWKSIKKDDYSLAYPVDWTLDESRRMGTEFILIAPQNDDASKDFAVNINLLKQEIPTKISLDEFAKLSKEQIANYVTDPEIVDETDTDLSGQDFKTMVYKGKQGVNTLQYHQYYTLKNDKMYILTLTTKADDYKTYKDVGVQIMETIKFN